MPSCPPQFFSMSSSAEFPCEQLELLECGSFGSHGDSSDKNITRKMCLLLGNILFKSASEYLELSRTQYDLPSFVL